jgi:cell division transport system permease protein
MRKPERPRKTERQTGAVHSQTRLGDKLDAWFAHHSAIDSLLRLLHTPGSSLITWLVVAIALTLPAALLVGLMNLQQLAGNWEDTNQISAFLDTKLSDAEAQTLRNKWQKLEGVAQVDYLAPADALTEFRDYSGLGRLIDNLDHNPLPGVLLVQPRTGSSLDALYQQLLAEPGVADVRIDMLWVQRLEQLMSLAERLVLTLACLLALGLILIVGNTLRLAIENRREEILVAKLVGATDAYVRRPFLYAGLWYGLGGGILASLFLALGLGLLSQPVTQLNLLYASQFTLKGLGLIGSLQLILAGGFLGLAGAWLAVARHLRLIRPH